MRYKNLVLLVGSNPLPNYVAAKMLLDDRGMLLLVHTPETSEIAGHIQSCLELANDRVRKFEILDLSKANFISEKMADVVDFVSEGGVHLHYTGGTKQMSVHSYLALEKKLDDRFSASYLDPRAMKLKVDGEDKGCDVDVKVPLKTLMKLHGIELSSCKEETRLKAGSSQKIIQYLQDGNKVNCFNEWIERNIKSECRCGKNRAKAQKNTPSLILEDDIRNPSKLLEQLQTDELWSKLGCQKPDKLNGKVVDQNLKLILVEVVNEIIEGQELSFFPQAPSKEIKDLKDKKERSNNETQLLNRLLLEAIPLKIEKRQKSNSNKDEFEKESDLKDITLDCLPFDEKKFTIGELKDFYGAGSCKDLCKWFAGLWLEDYVFECLSDVKSETELEEIKMAVERKSPQFDLDVVAIKNHQIFVISCTTEKRKGGCKMKLFEAHLRARQIGGDEARTALVCLSSAPDILEQELQGGLDKHIRVFGLKDLSNLGECLEQWIKKESLAE